METKELYREILNEHNLNPAHKAEMDSPTISLHGVNPSCGDNITLNLKVKDGIIEDGSFTGSGCAISQASVDMMLDLVIGRKREEAMHLIDIFNRMIKESVTQEELEELQEAAALQDISKMPARVKPLVQFPAITICAFIPSAEFCSFNSFKTSPAKSSVGMFLYALFFRPMKVLSPFIMNASDIFSVGCFQLEFFYFKPKFFKHFKIFLVGASFDCKKVSADEGVGSA